MTRRPAQWLVGNETADEALFDASIGKHLKPVIQRLATEFGTDTASDGVQAAAVELWQLVLRTRRRFSEGHLRLQLLMRARNRCVRELQSPATRNRVSEPAAPYLVDSGSGDQETHTPDVVDTLPSGEISALETLLEREAQARYRQIIDKMPEQEREAFDLVAGQDMKPAEAAHVLGIKPNAVRKRMRRAHQYLYDANKELEKADEEMVRRATSPTGGTV